MGRRRAGTLTVRAATLRWTGFLLLWLVLLGAGAGSLAAGVVASAAATWTSLTLLPAGVGRPSAPVLFVLALRFLRQSASAGLDVARRALDPRMPLNLGTVTCKTRLPPGPAQSAFAALTSLVPGTVPFGTDPEGSLLVHCLDVAQPVTAQMREEEALLCRVLGVTDD